MISYLFFQKNPSSHYIYIDMHIDRAEPGTLVLQLPAWRPGRYELGNFARNIKKVEVFDAAGAPLPFIKTTKDRWEVKIPALTDVKVTYSYYAADLNAGSCYADNHQLYVNPVHCCMYAEGRMEAPHRVELKLPDHYRIAGQMKVAGKTMQAQNYHELADSPFIASASLQSDHYEVNGIRFYLHFNGICKPELEKFKRDFARFTEKQLQFWKDFPVDEYHFLFQITPHRFYHGVEHEKSTVIAIGPAYAINEGSVYEDVLGVSSHELFHTWNVKNIRPAEMMPYNYTRENYARTGFVYEGFTTYYGDKLLYTSGVFSWDQYFATLQERLVKHLHNYGRFNLGVADSSFETWLDGYVAGAPYRKTSIYDEGSLIALMLDVKILEATKGERSLRDVCLSLYKEFGKKKSGYSEEDVIRLVNEVSGSDFSSFFSRFVYSATDYEQELVSCFRLMGLDYKPSYSSSVCEDVFGFKVQEQFPVKVTLVAPYSPAWKAGLFAGDEILAVNKVMVRNNLSQWLQHFSGEPLELTVNSAEMLRTINLEKGKPGQHYFYTPKLEFLKEQTPEQKQLFECWKKN